MRRAVRRLLFVLRTIQSPSHTDPAHFRRSGKIGDFGLSNKAASIMKARFDDGEPDISPLWFVRRRRGASPRAKPYSHPSPRRASPEALRGEPQTVHSDVYSFTTVLWECLARRLPFAPSGVASAPVPACWDVLAAVLDGDRPDIGQITWSDGLEADGSAVALANLMREGWSADASRRPTLLRILTTIERVLEAHPPALPVAVDDASSLIAGEARERRSYEIEFEELHMDKEVARGANGAVHIARWRSTTVAVKVLLRGATTEKDINEYVSRRANRDTLSHGPTSHFFRALYPQLPEGARPYLDPATPVRRRAPRRVHDAAQPVHRA